MNTCRSCHCALVGDQGLCPNVNCPVLLQEVGPYDEDPDLPLSYTPEPRKVSDEPPRPEALPPLVTAPPDDEGAHEQLRNLGFGTGDADLMLLDLETMESREHWLVVLAMAAKADEELTRG